MARASFYTIEQLSPRQAITPEGFLCCFDVALARTGIMVYGPDETPLQPGPEGIVKIYRNEEEVFRPETIASALGKSVTDEHPANDVTPVDWKELTHGIILNVRRGLGAQDDLLLADLLITTKEGIEAVQNGHVELSLGYDADYLETAPGVGKQSNIIINHVALVEQGRCGPRCAIKDQKHELDKTEVKSMSKVATRFSDKINRLLHRAYKAKDEEALAELKDEASEMTGELNDQSFIGRTAPEGEGEGVHIHIDQDGHASEEDEMEKLPDRTQFTDEDIQEHIDANAREHEEFKTRIAALEQLVKELTAEEAGEESGDEGYETESNTAMEEAMLDEIPEELQEESKRTTDSRYLGDSFRETVSMAEILAPGIQFPTYDSGARKMQTFKKICALRRKALDAAYQDQETQAIISDLRAGRRLDTKRMTCDAVRVLFNGAYAAKRQLNNTRQTADAGFIRGPDQSKVTSLADLNKRMADYYKPKSIL